MVWKSEGKVRDKVSCKITKTIENGRKRELLTFPQVQRILPHRAKGS